MKNSLTNPVSFTYLGFQINSLVDAGEFVCIDEVLAMAENHTLVSWLAEKVDLSLWEDDDRRIMNVEFDSIANAVDHERKLAVSKNGLCLLVAYCFEFIQHPPSRTLEDL